MKQLVNQDSILVYTVLNTDIFDDTLRWAYLTFKSIFHKVLLLYLVKLWILESVSATIQYQAFRVNYYLG